MDAEQLRAELISLIWSLKIAVERNPLAVPGVSFVHFNSMLRDEHYRKTVLSTCAQAGHAEIADLADQARAIDIPGQLIKRPERDTQATTATPAQRAQTGETAPASQAPPPPASTPARAGRALPLIAIGLLAVFSGMVIAVNDWLSERGPTIVSGSINQSTTWDSSTSYVLDGMVFVESGATLTIRPGTQVFGKPGSALVVTRDAKINAQGTRQEPIVMTSVKPAGSRQRGDWGGLVLLGNAPLNTGPSHIEGIPEHDPRGGFGGNAEQDSCGVLKYLRIEFAGYEISQDNELNGLTLGGCGAATLISHVQVHMGLDDGIEFFGGSAGLSHAVISNPGDDGLDWDRGWHGNGQFIVVQMGADEGDNAIEADSLKSDNDALPRSRPTLSNVTLVGAKTQRAQRGLLLRRGTGGDLRNFMITGFSREALDVRDQATARLLASNELQMQGWLVSDPAGRFFADESGEADDDGGFDEASALPAERHNKLTRLPTLGSVAQLAQAPNFTPALNSLADSVHTSIPQGEFWDEGANYAGAVRPGERNSWLDGWTAYPMN